MTSSAQRSAQFEEEQLFELTSPQTLYIICYFCGSQFIKTDLTKAVYSGQWSAVGANTTMT